jgi:hypothetical protein
MKLTPKPQPKKKLDVDAFIRGGGTSASNPDADPEVQVKLVLTKSEHDRVKRLAKAAHPYPTSAREWLRRAVKEKADRDEKAKR